MMEEREGRSKEKKVVESERKAGESKETSARARQESPSSEIGTHSSSGTSAANRLGDVVDLSECREVSPDLDASRALCSLAQYEAHLLAVLVSDDGPLGSLSSGRASSCQYGSPRVI